MLKSLFWLICAGACLSLVAPVFAQEFTPEPFAATEAEELHTPMLLVEDRIFILRPGGLYRFTPEAETWNVTASGAGLPPAPLHNMSVTKGSVWITGAGASFSDLRFDDWQLYRPGDGYPGTIVRDVESDLDYAYAGTDAGAARFDQYILEWETLSGPQGAQIGPVTDVAVGEDRVWFALDGGVGEFRKEAESFRIMSVLDQMSAPRVLALRQSARFLWAITDSGLARFDKELRTWTSFLAGVDLPQARIHQITLAGEDVWLGTDAGLWYYSSDTGIWRRDISFDQMPGQQVRSFRNEIDRLWVQTERAFAVYEKDTSRWIDFTTSVPATPDEVTKLDWLNETLILLTPDRIVYGLGQSRANPARFLYRSREVLSVENLVPGTAEKTWQVGLNESGLGVTAPSGTDVRFKGGATFYAQNEDPASSEPDGLGDMLTDTKIDLNMTGRLGNDRTLSGFYDSTDPENTDYQLTYRGNRQDVLRAVSVGEIDRQMYNTQLAPDVGLTGGHTRLELGERSDVTRRRRLTADAWVGERRTVPGRDVFYGGNRKVENNVRDIDYLAGAVFPVPAGWTAEDLRTATYYVINGSNDPNTEYGLKAGIEGGWNRLRPNTEFVIGPRGETLILAVPLRTGDHLVGKRRGSGIEVDLTDQWLSNHYWLALQPIPGSMRAAITDSNGSYTDPSGTSYLEVFGLDNDRDGFLDPERFSPITGLLAFPNPLPFPGEVYGDPPLNIYQLEYSYQSERSTFRLSHRHIIPSSVMIRVDRELMRPGVDYDLIPNSGIFVFFEHVLLDEDTVIEAEYNYEVGTGDENSDEPLVTSAQIGVSASDHIFAGVSGTHWSNSDGNDAMTANVNTRLEWKKEDLFLRLTPEVAVSKTTPGTDAAGAGVGQTTGNATAVGMQGRYKTLEVSASHRSLSADYATFEDRRTLLGRLREQSRINGLLELGRYFQAELEWDQTRSDRIGSSGLMADYADSNSDDRGTVSSLIGSVRLLRSGWPNLELKHGRILYDAAGYRQEKFIKRAELELSPDRETVAKLGIRRLWLRAFYQRSEREFGAGNAAGDSLAAAGFARRNTDQAFVRLNGSLGSPLSWNLTWEDQHTYAKDAAETKDLRRFQKLDGTLQSQPHTSVDAFVRYVANRRLFWYPTGGSGGFATDRLTQATLQLYPGRLLPKLAPLSFRFDLGHNQREPGEPGLEFPSTGSLFSEPYHYSGRLRTRNGVFETRAQITSRVRLVLRYEAENGLVEREALATKSESDRTEARLEITPRAGQVILRVIDLQSVTGGITNDSRRLFGEWNQTWGSGFLTSMSIEAQLHEQRDRNIGQDYDAWNPQAQITWRKANGKFDATLGGSLLWDRTQDVSVDVIDSSAWDRRKSLFLSVNLHPISIMSIKVQYGWNRSLIDRSDNPMIWRETDTDHDLRIRVHIRG